MLIFIFLLLTAVPGFAVSDSKIDNRVYNESIQLLTDRDIYCVGEKINFSVFYKSGSNETISKVVYVEVILPDGYSVCNTKIELNGDCVQGEIIIPTDLFSGNYYLRAYTKWMRNSFGKNFGYKLITVLNPSTETKLSVSKEEKDEIELKITPKEKLKGVSISCKKFERNKNSSIIIARDSTSNFDGYVNVSLVRAATLNTEQTTIKTRYNNFEDIFFIPDTRGISISGKVINREDSVPIPSAKVWLTKLNEPIFTREVLCDSNGDFLMDLGTEKKMGELFLYASTDDETLIPVIKINSDFEYNSRSLPFVDVEKNVETKKKDLLIYGQLESIYRNSIIENKIQADTSKPFFYGEPDFTLVLKEYVDLPHVEDYVKELMPMVKVKNRKGKSSLQVLGVYPELSLYRPLVMLDQIKIDNLDAIWQIPPGEIERIDVVKCPYLKGDLIYGGIIHFISTIPDFSRIKLPEESIIVNYTLFQTNGILTNVEQPHIPKISNCLFWHTAIFGKANNKLSIEFNTGTEPGNFQLKVEGVDENGDVLIYTSDVVIE